MVLDMHNPLYWSRLRPTISRKIPVYSPQPEVQQRRQPAETSSATPKVVQIPVHFVGSKPANSRSDSSLKIQKVFRGFLVRRSMKKIIAISRDVDEIERKISKSETLDLIRRDEKERLRMNEMLMDLLFKLDSVRGVDSGVRDCRRTVIKKAIAMQERIDAVVSAVDQSEIEIFGTLEDNGKQDAEAVAQPLEKTCLAVQNSVERGDRIEEISDSNLDQGPQVTSECKDVGEGEISEEAMPDPENPVADNCERVKFAGDLEMDLEEESHPEEISEGNCEVKQFGLHSETKVEEENCIGNEVADNFIEVEANIETRVNEEKDEERCVEKEIGESCYKTPAASECEESMETLTEGGEVNDVPLKCVQESEEEDKEKTEDNRRNRELPEKMREDNEKMMNLMNRLCQRNEMQTRMLIALTQRVEQLEKAFVCHRSKKKKGRHSA